MPRPNWFFAFPLDGAFLAQLPALPPCFRLYHPSDVHLTVTFLGACGEAAAERALLALDQFLLEAKLDSSEVALGQVTPMGPSRQYSALSALLSAGREETEARIAAVRDVLTESALGRKEKRPPKAHVTLARPMRRATAAQRAAGLAWAAGLDLCGVRAKLDRVALYSWDETRRERLFRVVAERALR